MDPSSARRVALMSIHPGYAEAILSGRKRAEFRKRPLAEDVSIVLIYATAPVSAIVGWFTVRGTLRATPEDIWRQLHSVGEICWHDFANYYSGYGSGVALLVGEVGRLARPVPLSGVDPSPATPQSFNYISSKILPQVIAVSENNGIVKFGSSISFTDRISHVIGSEALHVGRPK
jgi:predicted transcriptional regulator